MMKRLFISRDLVSYGNQALKVVPAITAAAPVTFSLVIGAAVIWVVVSIADRACSRSSCKGTIWDPLLMIVALIGISMPVFWLGRGGEPDHPGPAARHVPVLAGCRRSATRRSRRTRGSGSCTWSSRGSRSSVLYIGFYARVLRANLLDVANEDFVRTARAKGLSERRVLSGTCCAPR